MPDLTARIALTEAQLAVLDKAPLTNEARDQRRAELTARLEQLYAGLPDAPRQPYRDDD